MNERPRKAANRRTTNLGPGIRNRVPNMRISPRQQIRIGDLVIRTDTTVTLSFPGLRWDDVKREPVGESLRLDASLQGGT